MLLDAERLRLRVALSSMQARRKAVPVEMRHRNAPTLQKQRVRHAVRTELAQTYKAVPVRHWFLTRRRR